MATVLQNIYANVTAQSATAIPPGVWTNIPLSATITPTSAASVIKVQSALNCDRQLANVAPCCFRVIRNGTPVGVGVGGGVVCNGRLSGVFFVPYLFIDSPASVAALTYQFQFFDASGNTVYLNRDSTSSFSGSTTILLQEIG